MGSIVLANRDNVIERIEKGERLIDIAESLGLRSAAAIYNALGQTPEYIAARQVALDVRMEKRERELETAEDSVQVNRAKELLSHARWRAEREHPSKWGQTNKVQVEYSGDLGERLRRAKERTIQGEVLEAEQVSTQDTKDKTKKIGSPASV